MKDTNTNIEPKEVELIKVQTIKRKHIAGLRESFSASESNARRNLARLEFIGYITEWDAILYRNVDNSHLGVLQASIYYVIKQDAAKDNKDWQAVNEKAQALVHALPQLFLD